MASGSVSISLPRGDPYANPELFRFTGSMEGIPEWVEPAESPEERLDRKNWQALGNRGFERVGEWLPGVGIACALAAGGYAASSAIGNGVFGLERSPVSPILIAIALGLLVRNTIGLPRVYQAGLALCLRWVLRFGVALLGLRLSLGAVGQLGLLALPIAVASIATALVLVRLAGRALALPPRLATLVAVGTAICGNSAIVAVAPVIRAEEDEVSYAVGCVTLFGLVALIGYPFLSHALFDGDPVLAGFFLGTAIHDTAQVVGAGLLYAQQFSAASALDTATVTKLVRNLCMLGVIPLMAVLYRRGNGERASGTPGLRQLVPGFVVGFLVLALVRTLGDLGSAPFGGLVSASLWQSTLSAASTLSAWCLALGMAAVGLGTHIGRLRTLGLAPFAVGLAAALTVGAVSAGLITLLAPFMRGVL